MYFLFLFGFNGPFGPSAPRPVGLTAPFSPCGLMSICCPTYCSLCSSVGGEKRSSAKSVSCCRGHRRLRPDKILNINYVVLYLWTKFRGSQNLFTWMIGPHNSTHDNDDMEWHMVVTDARKTKNKSLMGLGIGDYRQTNWHTDTINEPETVPCPAPASIH